MKYLNANVEDAFGSVLASVKIGGSVAFLPYWQCHPDSGGAVLPVDGLGPLCLKQARTFVPPRLRTGVGNFVKEADDVLGQYLRGQLLVILIPGGVLQRGAGAVRPGSGAAHWHFRRLAIFVPYLGFGVGLVLATLAGLLEFSATSGVGYTLIA